MNQNAVVIPSYSPTTRGATYNGNVPGFAVKKRLKRSSIEAHRRGLIQAQLERLNRANGSHAPIVAPLRAKLDGAGDVRCPYCRAWKLHVYRAGQYDCHVCGETFVAEK